MRKLTKEVISMLIKLIKYDLKSILKTLLPLWLTALVISALLGLQAMFNPYIELEFIAASEISVLVLFALFIAIFVITILFIIQRFWNGLLKEEGYLMFTLPLKPRMLIFSKAISSLIITLISSIVAILCILLRTMNSIVSYQADLMADINDIIQNIYVSVDTVSILQGCFICLITFLAAIYRIYTAMAIGQLSNRNRFLCSFGAYIGLGIIDSLLVTLFEDFLSDAHITTYVIVVIELIVYHIVTEYLLTRKLNLE